MILVDTSVWIDHLRRGSNELVALLNDDQVLCHPFVIGELACGYLNNRAQVLSLLRDLPSAPCLDDNEVMDFIHAHKLFGKGLGYIDIHLLMSSKLTDATLWTLDKRLRDSAKSLRLFH